MSNEASFEHTDAGRVPRGTGWFVLNARDAAWRVSRGRGASCIFERPGAWFEKLGINITVLNAGETMGMYHWERDQENFLVLAGAPLLIVEGEERELRQWDMFHCPPGTEHIIIGAGEVPCVIVAVGTREGMGAPDWGGYVPDPAARRHGAAVDIATVDPEVAYAGFAARRNAPYSPGWLPGD